MLITGDGLPWNEVHPDNVVPISMITKNFFSIDSTTPHSQ